MLARGEGLNFSAVLNYALAAVLDIPYDEPALLRKRRFHMQELIKERFRAEKEAVKAEEAAKAAEKGAKESAAVKDADIAAAIWRALGGLGAVAFGRLPEFDRNGDYYEFWDRTAAAVSRAAGCPVSTVQVQEVVRRGRK